MAKRTSARRMVRLGLGTLALAGLIPVLGCGAQQPIDAASGRASGSGVVRGHVYWPQCQPGSPDCPPLDGVRVSFQDSGANQAYLATSDASGAYEVRLPAGEYSAIAGRADRSVFERRLSVKAGDTVTLDLPISPATGRS